MTAFVEEETPEAGPMITMSMIAYESRLDQARLEGYEEGCEDTIKKMEELDEEDEPGDFDPTLEELEFDRRDGHELDLVEPEDE